jgi:hypothetical protein
MGALIITTTSSVSTRLKLALEPKFYLVVSRLTGKDAIASEVNARKSIANVLMLVFLVDLIVNAKIVLTDLAKNMKVSHLKIAYSADNPTNDNTLIEFYKFIFSLNHSSSLEKEAKNKYEIKINRFLKECK